VTAVTYNISSIYSALGLLSFQKGLSADLVYTFEAFHNIQPVT